VSASERQDEEQMPRDTGTRQGRAPPAGDPHRGEDPAVDPPPEGRATQGTHTEHKPTESATASRRRSRGKALHFIYFYLSVSIDLYIYIFRYLYIGIYRYI